MNSPIHEFTNSSILRVCVRYYMRMRNLAWLLLAASTPLAQPPSPSPPQNPAGPAYQAAGTMSDLMVKVIYPTSDAVFYITTRQPTTEAEWGELQGKTLTLAESANLLMMPGRARDQDRWMQDAKLMLDAGRAAYRAARSKDLAGARGAERSAPRVVHELPPALSPELRAPPRRRLPQAHLPHPPHLPHLPHPTHPTHPAPPVRRSRAAGSFAPPRTCVPTARSRAIRGASVRWDRSSSRAVRATCRSCRAIRQRSRPAARRQASR